MAYYSLAMLLLAAELSDRNHVYDDMVVKFLEQFVLVMDALDASGLYDDQDGFFYDRIVDSSGASTPIRVQTLVGMIPLLPAVSLGTRMTDRVPRLRERLARLVDQRGKALQEWRVRGEGDSRRVLASIVGPDKLARMFRTIFDEDAFLSPYGLRSLSKHHTTPYAVPGLPDAVIDYQPAESRTAMYGGNSNWRGPVWFPTNYLAIRALLQYDEFIAGEARIEYPTGSGHERTLREVAQDIADRLVAIWLPDASGRRPVNGGTELFQTDPVWRDNLLFYEYFHGDNGAGLGASHQTGWTALVADLILDPPAAADRFIGTERAEGAMVVAAVSGSGVGG
jgi:hypothetical protein